MNLIKRQLLAKIVPLIGRNEAILIKGMRRTGKTYLLRLLQNILKKDYAVQEDHIYFFDLEHLDIREDFNQEPKNLLKYLKTTEDKQYVFIDEIQYLDNPSNFLKILVDECPNIKIFTTGSASLEIKRKIQDSMVGRVLYFQLYPLNFTEFLEFKGKQYGNDVTDYQKKKLDSLLKEYLTYGGLPAVVLEVNTQVKQELLKSYVDLYISKDIKNITEIENISGFNNLVKLLSSQIGNMLDKNELSNTLGMAFKTVTRYMDILQYTYIMQLLLPFFTNIRSRITKTPKIYFCDLGIRNTLSNSFGDVDFRIDKGELFENFIFLQLMSSFDQHDVFFYRNTKQNEIDFIVESKKICIEAKYKKFKGKSTFKVFENFAEFQNYIVNINFNEAGESYSFIDRWQLINKLRNTT